MSCERIGVAQLGRARGLTTTACVDRRGSLKTFLSEITGVDPASIICFLSDGQQLTDANIRQLAGSPEDVSCGLPSLLPLSVLSLYC